MGKTFVVTGAARGIGRAIALKLIRDGHKVCALDVDDAALSDLAGDMTTNALHAIHCDVSLESDVRDAFTSVLERSGAVHGLVNNAGIADPHAPPIERLSIEAWRRMLATNLDGVFLCCKYAVEKLRQARGAIVNIASTRALQSEANTEAYSASKGGVVALTHALAVSLGPAVRVNAISPGWIDTSRFEPGRGPMHFRGEDHAQHPAGRVGVPEDVAELVAYLLSEKAEFITGQNLVVDGGMTKKMIYAE